MTHRRPSWWAAGAGALVCLGLAAPVRAAEMRIAVVDMQRALNECDAGKRAKRRDVEVLAVRQLGRPERVDQDVSLVPVDLRIRIVELLLDADGGAARGLLGAHAIDVDRALDGTELRQAEVHEHQRRADDEHRHHDADHQRPLLPVRRRADEEAGLQIL